MKTGCHRRTCSTPAARAGVLLALCLVPGCSLPGWPLGSMSLPGNRSTANLQTTDSEVSATSGDLDSEVQQVAFQQSVPFEDEGMTTVDQVADIDGDLEPDAADGSEESDSIDANDDADAVESGTPDDFRSLPPPPPQSRGPLQLEQLLRSVAECYPLIEVAIGELESADGKLISTWGAFDDVFSAHSISQPLGFYQTYRNGVGINRPLYNGGEVYGTYRIGDGNFEPWYGERETNEAGEFKAGFSLPLLKDRGIDARRANVMIARAMQNELEADVESRMIQFQRLATQAYWEWLATGRVVASQEQLLELADERVSQIDKRVDSGDAAEIIRIDNDRLIAKRRNELIKSRRELEKAAIKLSLFLRDGSCCPLIPSADLLPEDFPDAIGIGEAMLQADIREALSVRPELAELRAEREQACIDKRYAENLTLPKLDLKGFAGQDIGAEASPTGDKTPFELQLGVLAEVPIQRREGIGKIRVACGKLQQIDAKLNFTEDKIRTEVLDAASAVNAAYRQILQATQLVELAEQSLRIGRLSFEAGDIDLIELNIYETAVMDAQFDLIDANFKYFYYLSAYEAAISGVGLVEFQ